MLWNYSRSRLPDKATLFRRVHERWLARALASRAALPHIPLRRVDRGGFDGLRARPGGSQRAEQWWSAAFQRLDLEALASPEQP